MFDLNPFKRTFLSKFKFFVPYWLILVKCHVILISCFQNSIRPPFSISFFVSRIPFGYIGSLIRNANRTVPNPNSHLSNAYRAVPCQKMFSPRQAFRNIPPALTESQNVTLFEAYVIPSFFIINGVNNYIIIIVISHHSSIKTLNSNSIISLSQKLISRYYDPKILWIYW